MLRSLRPYLIVLCLSCIFISPSCRRSTNSTDITIAQWGQERYLIYLPLYVAIEEGFLSKHGLRPKIIFTGNDDQTFATVISGNAQFGVGDPVFAAISQEKGYDAKVVATIVGRVAIWGIANNSKVKPIRTTADFEGLRVGTFPEPSTNYTLMRQLVVTNPTVLEHTQIVQAPIGSQLALLQTNKVDVAMELEPATSLAASKGYRIVFSSPGFYGPFLFTGLTTTQDFISKNPQAVTALVDALEEAVVACHKDRSVALRVASKLFPTLPKEVIADAVNRMLDEKTFPEHVAIDDSAWQAALKIRFIVGDLHSPQATSTAVDNSFALAATTRQ